MSLKLTVWLLLGLLSVESIYYVEDEHQDFEEKIEKILTDVDCKVNYSTKVDKIMHKVTVVQRNLLNIEMKLPLKYLNSSVISGYNLNCASNCTSFKHPCNDTVLQVMKDGYDKSAANFKMNVKLGADKHMAECDGVDNMFEKNPFLNITQNYTTGEAILVCTLMLTGNTTAVNNTPMVYVLLGHWLALIIVLAIIFCVIYKLPLRPDSPVNQENHQQMEMVDFNFNYMI